MFKLCVSSVCLGLTFLCQAQSVTNAVNVTINSDTHHQTIQAFGASDAWIIDPLIQKWMTQGKTQQIKHLAELLFSPDKGIGLTAWRFNIGAGSKEQADNSKIKLDGLNKDFRRANLMQKLPYGDIDFNAQAGQIRLLEAAARYQVPDLIAFVNSPPVWATRNGRAYPDKNSQQSNLQPEMLPAFSDFLVRFVKQLNEQKNIKINYISPINEPTWEWENGNQEGNHYTIAEMKSVYRSLYQTLSQHNLQKQVQIEGGEVVEYSAALNDNAYQKFTGKDNTYQGGMNKRSQGDYKNYLEHFLGDSEMRTILGNKLSLHGYFADATTDRLGSLRDIVWQQAQQISPGAELWMSEMCILGSPGDIRSFRGRHFDADNMEYAIHIARLLHRDLTRLNASAWHWWLAVTAYNYKDGLLKVNADLDAESLQASKILWTLGQFSRFIRPGYQRIEASGADDLNGLMVSAYQSPDQQKKVLVIINAAKNAQQLNIKAKNKTDIAEKMVTEAFITNQQQNLQPWSVSQKLSNISIPAMSTLTLIIESP